MQAKRLGMEMVAAWSLAMATPAAALAAGAVYNLTGLPTYPNLATAVMDDFTRTDALGHRCTRFAATTADSLDAVQIWYRRAMVGASETDLNNDANYGKSVVLSGIKLAVGVDSVVIYRLLDQTATHLELFRCSALGS